MRPPAYLSRPRDKTFRSCERKNATGARERAPHELQRSSPGEPASQPRERVAQPTTLVGRGSFSKILIYHSFSITIAVTPREPQPLHNDVRRIITSLRDSVHVLQVLCIAVTRIERLWGPSREVLVTTRRSLEPREERRARIHDTPGENGYYRGRLSRDGNCSPSLISPTCARRVGSCPRSPLPARDKRTHPHLPRVHHTARTSRAARETRGRGGDASHDGERTIMPDDKS